MSQGQRRFWFCWDFSLSGTGGMPFSDLPHEIIAAILQIALDVTTAPSDILCVCQLFRDIGRDYLYSRLSFASASQLRQFAHSEAPYPPIAPRSLVVDLTGKAPRNVLRDLCDVLVKCSQLANIEEGTSALGGRDARLKHIRLQMHSYTRDSAIDVLERGLRAVSPDTFTWTGPDPDHHFSIAIVPLVASCLFKQFSAWCNIREITITNISFATADSGAHLPLMGDIPSLRSLYIGQATFLDAQAIAGIFCQGGMTQLWEVRLVDAYSGSIWGPRLRRSDVERAVTSILANAGEQMAVIARVKSVVTCEKKTERIMGGDQVEGTHILN